MNELHLSKKVKMSEENQMEVVENDEISKPFAPTLDEFFEHPLSFSLRAEYLSQSYYVEDDTLLTLAVRNVNVDAVSEILKYGVDPNAANKKGITPISAAAHKGNLSILAALICAGAEVNALNTSGSTALIQAAHFGHLPAVKFLIEHGSCADFANLKGTTALMRACQEGHEDICKELIKAHVDVNRKNLEGMNALMLASQRGHSYVVMLLIQSGAEMDEQTSQGSTALILACKRGHEKVVEVLVSMGAEIYMRDKRSRTAIDTAIRRSNDILLKYLSTQEQIRRYQLYVWRIRCSTLSKLRDARNCGRLTFSEESAFAYRSLGIISRKEALKAFSANSLLDVGAEIINSSLSQFDLPHFKGGHSDSLSLTEFGNLISVLEGEIKIGSAYNLNVGSVVAKLKSIIGPKPEITGGIAPRPKYAEWQWPTILMSCFDMPQGIYEHIIEYLPLPRIWHWSLTKLKRRLVLAPFVAITDLCQIVDEMITDIPFLSSTNSQTMVHLDRNPNLISYIATNNIIPQQLLDELAQWAAVQSLTYRFTEDHVSFSSLLAKRLRSFVVNLFKYFHNKSQVVKVFGISSEILYAVADKVAGIETSALLSNCHVLDSALENDDNLEQDTETEQPGENDGEVDEGQYFPTSDDDIEG